jgi:hypothetical protein
MTANPTGALSIRKKNKHYSETLYSRLSIFLLKGESIMNKLDFLKGATELVVSIGVSSIVGNTIKLVKEPGTKLPKRFAIAVGGIVLSSMIADKAGEYATGRIDQAAESIDRILHPVSVITDVDEVDEDYDVTEKEESE